MTCHSTLFSEKNTFSKNFSWKQYYFFQNKNISWSLTCQSFTFHLLTLWENNFVWKINETFFFFFSPIFWHDDKELLQNKEKFLFESDIEEKKCEIKIFV
jgi:hypothetical protein